MQNNLKPALKARQTVLMLVLPFSLSFGAHSAAHAALPVVAAAAAQTSAQEGLEMVDTASSNGHTDSVSKLSKADHLWANILKTYALQDKSGLVRFDYAGLNKNAADMKILADYVEVLSEMTPSKMARNEEMAFWANLYNALTVQIVAQEYPVKSIRKIKSGLIPGPWGRDLVVVEGEQLSLNNIEHDILRPKFETPLVHYMVNCASIGCPNLKPTPWRAATLEKDQILAAKAFINSPRGAALVKGRLQGSSIYKWFKKDFAKDGGAIGHIRKYADEDLTALIADKTKIDKFSYNWNLNGQ